MALRHGSRTVGSKIMRDQALICSQYASAADAHAITRLIGRLRLNECSPSERAPTQIWYRKRDPPTATPTQQTARRMTAVKDLGFSGRGPGLFGKRCIVPP